MAAVSETVRATTWVTTGSRTPVITRAAGYAAMLLAVAAIGVPLAWLLSAAFKNNPEIYVIPATWIPREPTIQNFARAWNAAPFGTFYWNSVVVTTLGTIGKLITGTLTAYALVFIQFPERAKSVVFVLILGALMVPPQVTVVPNFLLMADLDWVNTMQALVIPSIPTAVGTFLLRQAFLGLPREVVDAARIDGAGHARLLWSVLLPLALPVLVTFTLLATEGIWNEFLWPLVITNTASMRTLPLGIFFLLDQEGNTQWGVVMAGTLFVIMPLIALFLWAQRHIVEGIAAGAIKG
ncbi:MAG: carbohydrate ABC transporter permease [Chloroflexota bacterium]